MTRRQRFALIVLTPFLLPAVRSKAQVAGEPPPVPIPPAEVARDLDPTARGLIHQALLAAIEAGRLQGQVDAPEFLPPPPVGVGPGGVRINVPGVRINVPGVQIGPMPPAFVPGPPPQFRLAELARRSWDTSDRLFQAAIPAARADDRLGRLLSAARQYAAALRALPGLPPADAADVARLNHAVFAMLDATALERLADGVGPNGPPAADLRMLAAQRATEALDAARLSPAAQAVVIPPPGVAVIAPEIRPALVLLDGSARDLLALLNDLGPRIPRNGSVPAVLPPPPQDELEPIP